MTLDAAETNTRDQGDWITETVRRVTDLERRLQDPASLAALGSLVAAEARRVGATQVVPASVSGERLISAAATALKPLLNGAGRTLVVEGYLATGVQIVRAARRAREGGASSISAVAVSANPAGAAFVAGEIGAPVLVLEP